MTRKYSGIVAVTEEELNRLLHHSSGRIHLAILLGSRYGMRIQEVANLRWSDVNLDAMTITIHALKTKRKNSRKGAKSIVKTETLLPEVAAVMRELLEINPDSVYVLTGREHTGKPLNTSTILRDYITVAKRAHLGPHKHHFHCLRHFLGFIMTKKGFNAFVIQGALRHRSVASTQVYGQADQETIDNAKKEIFG